MSFATSFASLRPSRRDRTRKAVRRKASHARSRPRVELLEERMLLSTTIAYSAGHTLNGGALSAAGLTVLPNVDGFSASDSGFSSAFAAGGFQALVIGENVSGGGSLSAATKSAIAGYVSGGGKVVVLGEHGNQSTFLNSVFGFSTTAGGAQSSGETITRVAGDGPATLAALNGTWYVNNAPGQVKYRANTGDVAAFTVSYGSGQVSYLSWDFCCGGTAGQVSDWYLELSKMVEGPSISSLSPHSSVINGGSFTLTVSGSAFQTNSSVNWNGSPLATTYVSSTQLTAVVPATDLAVSYGSASITVVNPTTVAGTSRPKAFYLNASSATAPTLTAPTSAAITSGSATLGGTVTNDNGSIIQKRGILYAPTATNSNPTLGGFGVIEVDDPAATAGTFTLSVGSLNASTGYSFVAFATNDIGTAYTSPVSTITTQARRDAWSFSSAISNSLSGYTFGSKFSTSGPITISDLGFWDGPTPGLAGSHPVGIWTDTGSLLAQTTVLPTDPLVNGFRYHSLTTPLSLSPGMYVVGGFYGITDEYGFSTTGFTTLAGITYLGSDLTFDSGGLRFPTSFSPGFNGYFGANFLVAPTQVATTTSLAAHDVTYNADGIVTVTVSSTGGTPTGTVQLSVDGDAPLSRALGADGTATFTLTSPNAGNHSLSASYAAQGNFAASSAPGILHVNQAPTMVAISTSTVTYNADGSANVTVTSAAGTPDGDVTLSVDGGAAQSGTLSGGSYVFTIPGPGAGPHDLYAEYAAQGNFAASSAQATLNVNQVSTNVSITAPTVTYNGNGIVTVTVGTTGAPTPTGLVTLSVDGAADQSATLAADGTATFTLTSPSAGDHTLHAVYAIQGNYAGSSADGTLHVNPAATLTAIAAPTVTYNANGTVTLTVSAPTGVPAPSGTITLSVDGGAAQSATLGADGTATFTMTSPSAGDHPLHAVYASQGNYFGNTVEGTLHVNQADLYVTANANSKTYGQTSSDTGTVTGVVGSDGITASFGSDGDIATADAGTYAITATLTDPHGKLGNYTVHASDATLTVNKADQVITWADPAGIVYGTALSEAQLNATVAGVAGGSPPGVLTYSPVAGTFLDAGNARSLTVSAAATTNYNAATMTVHLDVARAPLSVTANDASMYYGQTPAPTGTLTGVVNGDNITATYTTTASASSPVGFYAIDPSLNDPDGRQDNYSVASTSGTLTVNAAPTTMSLGKKAIKKGPKEPNATPKGSGVDLIYGDDYGSIVALVRVDSSIAPGDVAVPTGSVQFFMDGQPLGSPVTLSETGDAVSLDPGVLPAGTHTFSATYTPGDGNFTGSSLQPYSVTVALATPIIQWSDPADIVYGTPLSDTQLNASAIYFPGVSVTDGIPASGGLPAAGTFSYAPAAGMVLHAGAGQVLTSTFTPDDTANFEIVSATVAINVLMADQTIDFPAPADRIYGDAPIVLDATASSHLPLTYSVLSGPATISDGVLTITGAGTVTVQASQGGDGDHNPATPVERTFQVGQATPTIAVAGAGSFTYDGAGHAATAAVHGVGGADLGPAAVVYIDAQGHALGGAPVGVGIYTIQASYAGSANYTPFTDPSRQIVITPAHLTVTADDQQKTYDGSPFTGFTVQYSGFVNGEDATSAGIIGTPGFGGNAVGVSNAGSYTITPTAGSLAAANYDFPAANLVSGTLTIGKAHLTVTANSASKVYGDAHPTFTASYSGFKNGETLATSGVSGSPSLATTATTLSGVGSYPIAVVDAGTLGAANYDFPASGFASGQLNVTRAALTVAADNTSRVYGDANPTFTASYSGFKNGETLATSGVTGQPAMGASASAASPAGSTFAITVAQGSLAASNYEFATFVPGTLTITKATLTVAADNKSKVYGDANPTFTASYSGFKNGETLATSGVSGSPGLATTATTASDVGTYAITAGAGTLAATNYGFALQNGTLTIAQQQAHAGYTGQFYVTTTGSSASVTLSAVITGVASGDITRASVTFVDRNGSVLNATPLHPDASGAVSYTSSFPMGSYTIGIVVGYYGATDGDYHDDDANENVIIQVAQFKTGMSNGGGYIVNASDSSGLYPGNLNDKTNYGFSNKSGSPLKGDFNVVVRSGTKVYQFLGSTPTSLTFPATVAPDTGIRSAFAQIGVFQDITDSKHPIVLESAATAQVATHDRGEPGTNDSIQITVRDRTGAVLYSSGLGEQTIGGGNIQNKVGEQAAGVPQVASAVPATLTPDILRPIVNEAIARWQAAGIDSHRLDALRQVTFQVGDLGGSNLGDAAPGVITISSTAAGFGWFVDSTPGDDSEFAPGKANSPAAGRIDLLSVVAHELGHELGLAHDDGDDVMNESLAPGVRRVPVPVHGSPAHSLSAPGVAIMPPALRVAATPSSGPAALGVTSIDTIPQPTSAGTIPAVLAGYARGVRPVRQAGGAFDTTSRGALLIGQAADGDRGRVRDAALLIDLALEQVSAQKQGLWLAWLDSE